MAGVRGISIVRWTAENINGRSSFSVLLLLFSLSFFLSFVQSFSLSSSSSQFVHIATDSLSTRERAREKKRSGLISESGKRERERNELSSSTNSCDEGKAPPVDWLILCVLICSSLIEFFDYLEESEQNDTFSASPSFDQLWHGKTPCIVWWFSKDW